MSFEGLGFIESFGVQNHVCVISLKKVVILPGKARWAIVSACLQQRLLLTVPQDRDVSILIRFVLSRWLSESSVGCSVNGSSVIFSVNVDVGGNVWWYISFLSERSWFFTFPEDWDVTVFIFLVLSWRFAISAMAGGPVSTSIIFLFDINVRSHIRRDISPLSLHQRIMSSLPRLLINTRFLIITRLPITGMTRDVLLTCPVLIFDIHVWQNIWWDVFSLSQRVMSGDIVFLDIAERTGFVDLFGVQSCSFFRVLAVSLVDSVLKVLKLFDLVFDDILMRVLANVVFRLLAELHRRDVPKKRRYN